MHTMRCGLFDRFPYLFGIAGGRFCAGPVLFTPHCTVVEHVRDSSYHPEPHR